MNAVTFHTTDENKPVLIKECAHGGNICIHGATTGYVAIPRSDIPKLVNALVNVLAEPPAPRFRMVQENPPEDASEDVFDAATGKLWRIPANGTAAYMVGIASKSTNETDFDVQKELE